ncbi:OmpA family protein [Polyangium mundeleinium]|uniref:OmpA family protein n=1 Tax=Polyangium mundeleinium TaxID=2995306 RepID=A0ABT5ERL8_9BACT|nr:OmpA family protein [Polyangium mundeleinium]MDC0743366.1 OmpA family protein [Polyangium mundeleinium]
MTFLPAQKPHRLRLFGSLLAAASTLLLVPEEAHAQCDPKAERSGCINADNLWVHAGAGPFLSLGAPLLAPSGKASFGLALSYLSRPIGLRVASADPDGTIVPVIDNAVNATFLWSLGVHDRLEITAALPITFYQDGTGLGVATASDEELPRSSMRDVRFGFAASILPRPRAGSADGASVVGRFELAVPAGDAQAFASGRTITWFPSIVASYRRGRFEAGVEASARVRGEARLANARIGSQLGGSLGASFDILQDGWLTAAGEAFVLYNFAAQNPPARTVEEPVSPAFVPAEWILSATTAPILGGDMSFTISGGGPIPFSSEAAVTTPRFRFGLAARYAPTGRDVDGDGVLDRDDKCVKVAEDRDGFQDGDGCPDPDNDNDRIPDTQDRCRDAAETVDGFKDDDGCPDPDDDEDGVLDEVDACRNEAEDKDGFEDDDGCPDPDNDGDGLLDKVDRCPNGAEDKDGFKDDDGCPDPDNDLDQVLDAADQCPDAREDLDGFQDDDGCPEIDNDEDGIADKADKCPLQAETIDGKDDADGCPEAGAKSLVRWSGDRIVAETPARFTPGKADVAKPMEEMLRQMAQLAAGRAPIATIVIEGYADRTGDESPKALGLAEKRAIAVKDALVAAGLPADRITAATGDPGEKRAANVPQFEITVQRDKRGKRR